MIEEGANVEIERPGIPPTALSCDTHGLQCRFAWSVPIGIRMEVFLQLRLQVPFDHGLGDAVRNSGNSQLPLPAPSLVDLHSPHGRWKVAAGRHSIPELVEIAFQLHVKLLDRLIVHTGCSPVRLYP